MVVFMAVVLYELAAAHKRAKQRTEYDVSTLIKDPETTKKPSRKKKKIKTSLVPVIKTISSSRIDGLVDKIDTIMARSIKKKSKLGEK